MKDHRKGGGEEDEPAKHLSDVFGCHFLGDKFNEMLISHANPDMKQTKKE